MHKCYNFVGSVSVLVCFASLHLLLYLTSSYYIHSKDFAIQAGFDMRQQNQLISTVDNASFAPTAPEAAISGGGSQDRRRQFGLLAADGYETRIGAVAPFVFGQRAQQQRQKEQQAPAAAAPTAPFSQNLSMDLNEFLRYHSEHVISSTMQECHLLSARTFRQRYTQSMESEWQETKKEILQYLGCNVSEQKMGKNLNSVSLSMNLTMNMAPFNPNNTTLAIMPATANAMNNSNSNSNTTNTTQLKHPSLLNFSRATNTSATGVGSVITSPLNATNATTTARNANPPDNLRRNLNQRNPIASGEKLNAWECEFALVTAQLCGNRIGAVTAATSPTSPTSATSPSPFIAPFAMFANAHQRLCVDYFGANNLNNSQQREEEEYEQECIEDLWRCMSRMTGENASNGKFIQSADVLVENVFAPYYQRNSLGLRRFLADNARAYLERAYLNKIRFAVKQNMENARLGGAMSNFAYITAFVRLQFQNQVPENYESVTLSTNHETLPLFPLLYYCLRVGEIDDCIRIAAQSGSHTASVIAAALKQIQQSEWSLQQQLVATHHQQQQQQQQQQQPRQQPHKTCTLIDILEHRSLSPLDSEFWQSTFDVCYKNRVSHSSSDPFEVVMFLVLGRFVDSTRDGWIDLSPVLATTEDYVWYKLCTVIDEGSPLPAWMSHYSTTDAFATEEDPFVPSTMDVLRQQIVDLGPNHFENPLIFVMTLLLTQQFETAIDCLFSVDALHAIHLGMCLNYYGLLFTTFRHPITENENEHGNEDQNASDEYQQQLLFDKVRRHCTKIINAADSEDHNHFVFFYLYLLAKECQPATKKFIEYLARPNPRFMHEILGSIGNNGIRIQKGLLFRFPWPVGSDYGIPFPVICLDAAQMALDFGEKEHSIHLFMFGGNYPAAARQCSSLLASTMMLTNGSGGVGGGGVAGGGGSVGTGNVGGVSGKHEKRVALEIAKDLCAANSQRHAFHDLPDNEIQLLSDDQLCNLVTATEMSEFFGLFYAHQQTKAMEVIKKCRILPVDDRVVSEITRENRGFSGMSGGGIGRSGSILSLNAQQQHRIFAPYTQKISKLEKELRKFVGDICLLVMEMFAGKLSQLSTQIKRRHSPAHTAVLQQRRQLSILCAIVHTFFNCLPSKLCETTAKTATKIDTLLEQTRIS